MTDLIEREAAIALRDTLADMIGALPMSSIHSALSEYRNAIRALPAAQVTVKPLEWHNYDAWTWWAESTSGTYRVEERNGVWKATLNLPQTVHIIYEYETDGSPNDFEAAILASQADYDARIRAALDMAPVTLAEAARVLLDDDNAINDVAASLSLGVAWQQMTMTEAVRAALRAITGEQP